MTKLIFLKLGGSLITDKQKPYTARVEVIKDIAEQIKSALAQDPNIQLILGNGAGSFAHYAAKKYNYPLDKNADNFKEGFSAIQQAAIQLNRIVVDELIQVGIPAISIHPSSFIVTRKGSLQYVFTNQLEELLKCGMVPVVYGDTIVDSETGMHIYSTEKVFESIISEFLKKSISVHSIIQATVVPGILDKHNQVMPEISKDTIQTVKSLIYQPTGFDVTGGMMHKIEYCLQMANQGIRNIIVSGLENDRVKDALLQKQVIGTRIG